MNKGAQSKDGRKAAGAGPLWLHLPGVVREALFDRVIRTGLACVDEVLETERVALCGERYEHLVDRQALRARHVASSLVFLHQLDRESVQPGAQDRTAGKHWQSGTMVLRWTAAGVLEAERGFRKLAGYRAMPSLVAALRTRDAQFNRTLLRVDASEKAA